MKTLTRRNFIKLSTAAGAGLVFATPASGIQASQQRLFKMSLNPYAIGVNLNQNEMLEAALQYGFEAILPVAAQLEQMNKDQQNLLLAEMRANQITWDAAGLPVDFRKDDKLFKKGIATLPKLASTLQQCNVSRVSTWIMPTDQELTYMENFKRHVSRLTEVCCILEDHDLKLGLEYVGPKTLTSLHRYPFISSMREAFELISEINRPNLGIQLDSFHWYCAEETVADITSLTNEQIITCDLNDATAGRTVAEQIDGERELPGDSGVIDLESFMKALVKVGYDGPVRAEPFNARLNKMENPEALSATAKAMKRTMALV